MRIVVLNGVNLDVLGRRDPETYGGMTLSELETKIYEWANELGCTVRCRQTNHEGEFVDWCHDALDWADGIVANPSAWTHYSWAIRDAVELFTVPFVEVHLWTGARSGGASRCSRGSPQPASSGRAQRGTARRSSFS